MLNTTEAANSAQIDTDKLSALGKLDTQKRGTQTKKEDANAAARRIYQELQMGNNQRFGKATSAGQGVSEIQGAELQRQFGQTSRAANETFQQIETAIRDVESQAATALMQVKAKTTELLTQAKLNFSNLINQIAQGRAQTEQQKSQMRLNALMTLRNEAFQIQQQKVVAEQQINMMKEQQKMNIEAYKQTAGTAVGVGQTAATNFNPTYDNFSKLQAGTQFAQPVTMQGRIVKGKDYLGRTIWGSATGGEDSYGWTNPQA